MEEARSSIFSLTLQHKRPSEPTTELRHSSLLFCDQWVPQPLILRKAWEPHEGIPLWPAQVWTHTFGFINILTLMNRASHCRLNSSLIGGPTAIITAISGVPSCPCYSSADTIPATTTQLPDANWSREISPCEELTRNLRYHRGLHRQRMSMKENCHQHLGSTAFLIWNPCQGQRLERCSSSSIWKWVASLLKAICTGLPSLLKGEKAWVGATNPKNLNSKHTVKQWKIKNKEKPINLLQRQRKKISHVAGCLIIT